MSQESTNTIIKAKNFIEANPTMADVVAESEALENLVQSISEKYPNPLVRMMSIIKTFSNATEENEEEKLWKMANALLVVSSAKVLSQAIA